jgi:hydroxyacylglutathione hydrolase
VRRPAISSLSTPTLGNRSYVAALDGHAVVVDPPRDLDRLEAQLSRLSVSHVLETHVHNDYVTGGLALARRLGADYVLNAADAVAFDRVGVAHGQVLDAGPMRLRVVATPGHTPTHLAYVLAVDGVDVAVFSGGSMLFGATGRTDLIDPARTEELARLQHASVRRLAEALDGGVQLLPTHGFGSFCSSGGSGEEVDASTVGEQRATNPALTEADVDAFVRETVAGLGGFPRYYREMGARNAAGPDAPDLTGPPPMELDEVDGLRARGTWVVDLRPRTDYAGSHVPGTVNVEGDGSVATYLGWVMATVEDPVALLAEDDDRLDAAHRDLARIGVDHVVAARVGSIRGPGAYRTATFADLAEACATGSDGVVPDVVVLDVRRDEEVEDGAVVGSTHIPLPDVPGRLDDIPDGVVWVHCATGFRAAMAASMVAGAGREVVLVDDTFEEAAPALRAAGLLVG